MIDHRQIDQRSLAFSTLIAQKLRDDPGLVDFAKANLKNWMMTCSPRARSTLQEWSTILNGQLDGVIEVLTSTDERAVRLRQSNPFAGVLSQQERNAILLKFKAHDPATT